MQRQSRARRTRAAIIDSAAVEFGKCGYGAASVKRIFEGSDVSKGSVYFHFDSKDKLAEAVLETADRSYRATIVRWLSRNDLSPLDIVHAIVDEMATRLEHDSVAQAEFRLVTEPELFDRVPTDSARALVETLQSLTKQAIEQNQIRSDVDPNTYVRTVLAVLAGQRYLPERFGIGLSLRTRFGEAFELITESMATPEWVDEFHRTGWRAPARDEPGR
ncbi:TetR family transcriptional regulator [Nocardia heshunensis]